jgi:hypothetical protein
MAHELIDRYQRKQLENFGLSESSRITSFASAEKFLGRVGIALRYWGSEKLPLASLYQAVWGRPDMPSKSDGNLQGAGDEIQRIAIELTNHLLGSHKGIEVNVIADRLTLVHRDVVPSLYTLVRRHRSPSDIKDISALSKKVFQFVLKNQETTAGQVRKFIGIKATGLNNDPAYNSLEELQRHLLIDRGPFVPRQKGIAYLSKEGYPYHCFHLAHKELVEAAEKLNRTQAIENFILAYLRGAIFVTARKLTSMFKIFLSSAEIGEALSSLLEKKKVSSETIGRDEIFVFKG